MLNWLKIIVGGAGLVAAGEVGLACWSARFRRPAVYKGGAQDILILAAHQDDCVIMAGEYAAMAKDAGKKVQVVYLTCGSERPTDARAAVRDDESRRAWASLGVSPEDLTFLKLPQAPVEGPSLMTAADIERAGRHLVKTLIELPKGAAVFVPASGEAHCDHRTLRELALQAWKDAERPDLIVYEVPEYNAYYSLWNMPARTLMYMARSLPFVDRFVKARDEWMRARFLDGARATILPPSADRLAKKRELLRHFTSENGELLVRYFGYPDLFRKIPGPEKALRIDAQAPRCWFKWGGRKLGPSVVLLWFALWLFCLAVVALCAELLAAVSGVQPVLTARIAAIIGILACIALTTRHRTIERRCFWLACGGGFIVAAIAR
jgi:LmbE family N-acetylglucosaminyl deacetylase